MTDLVERLGSGCNCGKCKMDLCCCHTMEEAKDRIEQLEAEIARKDALMEKVAQAAIDAARDCVVLDSGVGADDVRALSASEIVKGLCGG